MQTWLKKFLKKLKKCSSFYEIFIKFLAVKIMLKIVLVKSLKMCCHDYSRNESNFNSSSFLL